METAALETFSDGVFAIAATLLILESSCRRPRVAWRTGSLHIWPSYAAYAVSFLTIGIMWINHHAVFPQIDRVDRTFLAINVVFLMVIAFIPFPTRVLAEHLHHDAKAAAFFYGLDDDRDGGDVRAALVLRGARTAADRRRGRPARRQRHLPRRSCPGSRLRASRR